MLGLGRQIASYLTFTKEEINFNFIVTKLENNTLQRNFCTNKQLPPPIRYAAP